MFNYVTTEETIIQIQSDSTVYAFLPQEYEYKETEEYEYNDSDYEYIGPKHIEQEVLLKHPEIVHSDLFKNVPTWSEQGKCSQSLDSLD